MREPRRLRAALSVGLLALVGALVLVGSSSGQPGAVHAGSMAGIRPSDARLAIEQARYRAAAYPQQFISPQATREAHLAAAGVPLHLSASDFPGATRTAGVARAGALHSRWVALGPAGGHLSNWTQHLQNELPFTSGRVTALLLSPTCVPRNCRLWLGAAGGGVWRTSDALAIRPQWTAIDRGLGSNSIGDLVLDPNDPSHRTIYAGTGEDNLSFDSEAGTGLYKSVNGGDTWSLVSGSPRVAYNNGIGAIAIEPGNPSVIWLGVSTALRGTKDQAAFYPPAATPGLYRSTDRGRTFVFQTAFGQKPYFSQSDVTGLTIDPIQPDTVYASTQGTGVWRSAPAIEGDAKWRLILPSGSRTQVAISSHSRVWITDGSGTDANGQGNVFRIDNAGQPSGQLAAIQVSSAVNGASGFCHNQCSFDQGIAVDPAHPDTVWVGGVTDYAQANYLGGSNGRTVLRSVDGGRSWTDLTTSSSDELHGLHSDVHAIVLDPSNPNIGFIGTDGGIERTSGAFANGVAHTAAPKPCTSPLCLQLLSAIPTKLIDMNAGLNTLQFNKVSVPNNGSGDVQGGTQDNGTFEFNGRTGQWLETLGGDGGFTAVDATQPRFRMTEAFGTELYASRHGGGGHTWHPDAGLLAGQSANAFQLMPLIADPVRHATAFVGTNQIWRTTTFGPWAPLGFTNSGTISVISRAPSDRGTLWAGTGVGHVVITKSADASRSGAVRFTDLRASPLPERFVTGIAIDSRDPNHAWISYTGYNLNTKRFPGHVFSARYHPRSNTATFRNISRGIGDQPVDDLAYDPVRRDLYAATDFGVLRLPNGAASWERAAPDLPIATVFGVTISPQRRELYAATNGRGVYTLRLPSAPQAPGRHVAVRPHGHDAAR